MDEQNRNLILAMVLSIGVIVGWTLLFPPEQTTLEPVATADGTVSLPPAAADTGAASRAETDSAAPLPTGDSTPQDLAETQDFPKVAIETPNFEGSLSLQGGRIDNLSLNRFNETLDPDSPKVHLLKPQTEPGGYFAAFGWAPGGSLDFSDVPDAKTEWAQVGNGALTPQTPVTLEWQSPAGLTFRRIVSVDDRNMFTVTQEVQNTGTDTVRLAPYSELVREGEPEDLKGFFIIHEGAIQQTGEQMNELDYGDLRDLDADPAWGSSTDVTQVDQNGWLGFTDHYWMAMLIPPASAPFSSILRYEAQTDRYRTIARLETLSVEPGATASAETRLFAGAKEWETIREYQNDEGVYKFVDSIDWGWFFFLTKPIFRVLHALHAIIGNMGWSILALTLLIKAILFPLAYRSYVSMAKMKELQPQMEKIKEKAGDDRQKLQQEMMQLYKKEKVNPASGCLPILMQIPIFFSLYKVIFVTIELRHAAWFGWIQDLSSPDPSSILNLFGLLPFAVPDLGALQILSLGILPILLGISMWLQQKLNPAPTDPTQAMIFAWMPWIFMFMLGSFASGLVLYWIANNTITFTQQYIIMRSQGYRPDVFGNIKSGFRRKKASEDK